ncbi:MAG: cardiolipin synthase [Desulfosalsimonadaceae bacterium]
MEIIYNFYFGISILLSLVTAGHALLHKQTPSSALGWIAVCLIFPFAGALLYFLFGINRVETRARKLESKSQSFSAHTQHNYEEAAAAVSLVASELRLPRSYAQIARISDKVTRLPLVDGNRVDLLPGGETAYPEMLESIEQAEHYVFLTTYIFEANHSGRQFIDALTRAVRRGLDVRVLIDGVGEYYYFPRAGTLLKKNGVRVARFIPPRLFPPNLHINLRNHRKILIADGQIGYTGGMNIGDRHLAHQIKNRSRVQDMHFRLKGPVVMQMEQSFLEDWAFCTGDMSAPPPPTPIPSGPAICRTITDGPNEDLNKLATIIVGAISSSREQVLIMTPYFLPSLEMISALQSAALRGIDVKVVLPALNNLPFIHWATNNMVRDLLYWGVRIYYQPPPFAHTKLFVIDQQYAQIGSANLDPRSLRLNFELAVEIYEQHVARTIAGHIEHRIKHASPLALSEIEQRPLIIKIRDALMWLFSPYF